MLLKKVKKNVLFFKCNNKKIDIKQAIYWFKKSINNGCLMDNNYYTFFYIYESGEVKRDSNHTLYWQKKCTKCRFEREKKIPKYILFP
jgi:TPR repeat protein